jgi:hypothetical protein
MTQHEQLHLLGGGRAASSRTSPSTCRKIRYRNRSDTTVIVPEQRCAPIIAGHRRARHYGTPQAAVAMAMLQARSRPASGMARFAAARRCHRWRACAVFRTMCAETLGALDERGAWGAGRRRWSVDRSPQHRHAPHPRSETAGHVGGLILEPDRMGPNHSGSDPSNDSRSGFGVRLLAGTTLRLRLRLDNSLRTRLYRSLDTRSRSKRGSAVLISFENCGLDTTPCRHFETVGVGPLADGCGLFTGSTGSR